MSRIRLNQEYRNKIANRMRVHLEQEDTIEKQNYDNLKAQQIDLNDNALEYGNIKLFVGIILMMMFLKHNIFKISLRMLTLSQKIVVFIFIIWE